MRGLKPLFPLDSIEASFVAPFTGAWIETDINTWILSDTITSHPSRVRGLKRMNVVADPLTAGRTLHGCVD